MGLERACGRVEVGSPTVYAETNQSFPFEEAMFAMLATAPGILEVRRRQTAGMAASKHAVRRPTPFIVAWRISTLFSPLSCVEYTRDTDGQIRISIYNQPDSHKSQRKKTQTDWRTRTQTKQSKPRGELKYSPPTRSRASSSRQSATSSSSTPQDGRTGHTGGRSNG